MILWRTEATGRWLLHFMLWYLLVGSGFLCPKI